MDILPFFIFNAYSQMVQHIFQSPCSTSTQGSGIAQRAALAASTRWGGPVSLLPGCRVSAASERSSANVKS